MAVRQTASKQSEIAATLALLALGAWYSAPALAASDHDILCEESHSATLQVARNELIPRPVSHDVDSSHIADMTSSSSDILSKDPVLKKRVDATVREVFADTESEPLTEAETAGEPDDNDILEPHAPRMSDGQFARFKRQMYRKDI
jgi:hypothetical protein